MANSVSISRKRDFLSSLSSAPLRAKLLYFLSNKVTCSGDKLNSFLWSYTAFTRRNKASFNETSLLNAVSKGETSCAIFCISSQVSAEFKLKKIEDKRSKVCPEKSKASMVFSKVGNEELLVIASISARAAAMVVSKAGW